MSLTFRYFTKKASSNKSVTLPPPSFRCIKIFSLSRCIENYESKETTSYSKLNNSRRRLSIASDRKSSHSNLMSSSDVDYHNSWAEDVNNTEDDAAVEKEIREEAKRQAIRDEINSRTGRLWTDPWEITEEEWGSGQKLDDLPDWTPGMCSRVSLERVKVHPGK